MERVFFTGRTAGTSLSCRCGGLLASPCSWSVLVVFLMQFVSLLHRVTIISAQAAVWIQTVEIGFPLHVMDFFEILDSDENFFVFLFLKFHHFIIFVFFVCSVAYFSQVDICTMLTSRFSLSVWHLLSHFFSVFRKSCSSVTDLQSCNSLFPFSNNYLHEHMLQMILRVSWMFSTNFNPVQWKISNWIQRMANVISKEWWTPLSLK